MKPIPLATALLLSLCFSVHAQTRSPDDGGVKNNLYYNSYFGFAFNYPKDWHIPDDAVNERIRERANEEAAKTGTLPQMKSTYLLFTATRHPPGTTGIKLNPTILVVAESIAAVQGNPSAKDYLLGLRPMKMKRGVEPVLKEPVQFRAGGFDFFRDDYSGKLSDVPVKQSIFVHFRKGYAIVFSFLGEDQKSLAEMAASMSTILPLGRGGNIPKRPN